MNKKQIQIKVASTTKRKKGEKSLGDISKSENSDKTTTASILGEDSTHYRDLIIQKQTESHGKFQLITGLSQDIAIKRLEAAVKDKKLDVATLPQLVSMAAIAQDKALLLSGQPTERVEQLNSRVTNALLVINAAGIDFEPAGGLMNMEGYDDGTA